jgi:isovaleryl-CoA dehydrogenase
MVSVVKTSVVWRPAERRAIVFAGFALAFPGGIAKAPAALSFGKTTAAEAPMRATPDFDFQLGESAAMIRETVGRFADEQIMPLADRTDREDKFPRELWQPMGELGLHGITVEEEWGGLGLGYLEHVIAVEEVSRASASIGLSYGAHSNLCLNQIRRWGNDEQKAKYLPGLISGEHVGSLAMSEAGAGSDVVSMTLKADAVQGGYVLNGTKFWITNAPEADTLVVYAKTDRSAGSRGITAFLIEKGMPGFSIGQIIKKVGMKGSPTAELVFDGCAVPEENVMGPVNGGVGVLMSGLDYERVVLSGLSIGIMQACLDTVIPYVRERKQFGKAIGSFQLMQGKIADMYVAMQTARAYTYAVAKACDAGQTTRFDAAGAILYASESSFKVAAESVQALGGAGYTLDWPVERYMRDAKLLDIGAGTNEIRRMLIGRELIGAAG